jgi:hypothetical protein
MKENDRERQKILVLIAKISETSIEDIAGEGKGKAVFACFFPPQTVR